MKKGDSEMSGSFVLSHPGREKYAHLRSQGYKSASAAKLCHVSKNTACRWGADGEVKARIAFLTKQSVEVKRDVEETGIRPISFGTNDVLMDLWEIGHNGKSEHARVSALNTLTDILLMRARCMEDLRNGIGWLDDEKIELYKTGFVPARIAELTGARTVDDLAKPPSLRGEK